MGIERKRIIKKYIILCEGVDTLNFIINYLNSDALKYDSRFYQDIQALDFGGINQLDKFIRNLQNMDGYESVNRLLIIRDAETNVANAIHMIQNSLKSNGLPVPDKCNQWEAGADDMKTAYTLMPTCNNAPIPGALEDLCWDILRDDPSGEMRSDILAFVNSISGKYNSVTPHEHKSRLHSFFSVNTRYISLKIGEAAKAGAFDWNNSKLDSLRRLFEDGFEEK